MSRLFLVGVGPGDPELLTRKAERILREADVIAAPVTAPNESSQALGIVSELLDDKRHHLLPLLFPMSSDRDSLIPHWKEACRLVAERVHAGKTVAFIALGDPMFYATSLYLLDGMRREYPEVPVEVVPGVSSIFAAAAAGCFPLAEGTERVAVLPATAGMEAVRDVINKNDTVILLKVKPAFDSIMGLIEEYPQANILFAQKIGMAGQVVLTDRALIAAFKPDYLSLLIIRQQSA